MATRRLLVIRKNGVGICQRRRTTNNEDDTMKIMMMKMMKMMKMNQKAEAM
jgi:hypothetical protein